MIKKIGVPQKNLDFRFAAIIFLINLYNLCFSQELPQITPLGEEIGTLQFNQKLILKNKFISPEHSGQFKNQKNSASSDVLSLPFVDDFSVGNYDLWLDSFAFINNSFAVNPPTIGVATFDGTNQFGQPYDFSSQSVYGNADVLTSKPIDLSNLTADSQVVFSFYYQPQGLGDFPETTDSLSLEFYSPLDELWYKVWSTRGQTTSEAQQTPVFQFHKISIADSKFLQYGFQFRFRNKATLSGMHDIWNIDYVYLDKYRNINDNSIPDFAFVSIENSFLNSYTSMPMKSFKGNGSLYMKQNFNVKLANLSSVSVSNDSNRYFVFLYDTLRKESVNFSQTFSAQSQQNILHSVFISPNNYQFLPIDSPRVVYEIKFIAEQTGISNELSNYNDTVTHLQIFDSYYSYDDGSAEKVYSITPTVNVSPSLAYKFTTLVSDSLRGVYFNFPKYLYDYSQLLFKITVWNDNGGVPGSIIYQSVAKNPVYADEQNELVRYEIEYPVLVSDIFYVGFEQNTPTTQDEKIRIGFDKNINNQSKIFFNTGSGWNNASVAGSLLIRPDFGKKEQQAFVSDISVENDFEIFPNSNNGTFTVVIKNLPAGRQGLTIQPFNYLTIYNIWGEEVYSDKILNLSARSDGVRQFADNLNLSLNLPSGIYFIKISDDKNNHYPLKKIIVVK